MPAKTTDPTIPIVIREGAGTSGSHFQTLYFDLSAAPIQYLKLTDCPAALEKHQSCDRPACEAQSQPSCRDGGG